MKKIRETAFCVICLAFSAVLLILSMLTAAEITALNDRAAAWKQQAEQLEKENRILSVRWESSINLETLACEAQRILGMQRCSPAQMIYVTDDGVFG